MQALTRFNARLARYGMYFSVGGLFVIVAIVAFQVFGRYVMNDSPTWTENLALVLILYVTLIGGGVVVRYDRGHRKLALLLLASQRARAPDEMSELLLLALV